MSVTTVKDAVIYHLEHTFEKEAWQRPLGMAVWGLTASQAAWKPSPERHSIWQIVRHVIRWKRGVLKAWSGDPPDYEMIERDDWGEVSRDQAAWEADVKVLHDIYTEFRERLQTADDEGLQRALRWYQQASIAQPVALRLIAVFTHDIYHAGQIQYLRALQGIPADQFFAAVWKGDLARVREVLDGYPNLLNASGPDGWTGLQLAAYGGHEDVARLLLDRGAHVQATSTNQMANTALHGAIAGKRARLVALLLDRGADPEATDSWGNAALHLAAHEGNSEIVETLLGHRVNLNSRRKDGKTPLAVAVSEGKAQVANIIRRQGGIE